MTASASGLLDQLFVYGTLRHGDVRWRILQPYVVAGGVADAVPGELFDTGLDYPAAVFAEPPGAANGAAPRIVGERYTLAAATLADCLAVLDEEEDTVGGLYRRVVVSTHAGVEAWAYAYGSGLDLTPIPSGDWFRHRPPA